MALGITLILVVVFAVLLTPGGDPTPLPEALQSVSPQDGAIVQRQTSLEIDMEQVYAISLTVDGVLIPPAEIVASEPTGQFRWTPGPTSTFSEWTPGQHAVQIEWKRPTGFPDPGTYRWSFRVQ